MNWDISTTIWFYEPCLQLQRKPSTSPHPWAPVSQSLSSSPTFLAPGLIIFARWEESVTHNDDFSRECQPNFKMKGNSLCLDYVYTALNEIFFSTDWLPRFHGGQKCECCGRVPGGIRGQCGGLFWAPSAGGSEGAADPSFATRWWIHLPTAWRLSASQTTRPIQHHCWSPCAHPF